MPAANRTVVFVQIFHASLCYFFFFQAEDGIRDYKVTGVQTCALPIFADPSGSVRSAMPTATPISGALDSISTTRPFSRWPRWPMQRNGKHKKIKNNARSEEHTSELQSPCNLVCRLLLEKKK